MSLTFKIIKIKIHYRLEKAQANHCETQRIGLENRLQAKDEIMKVSYHR